MVSYTILKNEDVPSPDTRIRGRTQTQAEYDKMVRALTPGITFRITVDPDASAQRPSNSVRANIRQSSKRTGIALKAWTLRDIESGEYSVYIRLDEQNGRMAGPA